MLDVVETIHKMAAAVDSTEPPITVAVGPKAIQVCFEFLESHDDGSRTYIGDCTQCAYGVLVATVQVDGRILAPAICEGCETKPVALKPPTAPRCKSCGKFLAPDTATGKYHKTCGECRETKLASAETRIEVSHNCEGCGGAMTGRSEQARFCTDCIKARNLESQARRNKTFSKKKKKEAA